MGDGESRVHRLVLCLLHPAEDRSVVGSNPTRGTLPSTGFVSPLLGNRRLLYHSSEISNKQHGSLGSSTFIGTPHQAQCSVKAPWMRFTDDSLNRVTWDIRETEPDFVPFRLWLYPGFRYLSVDKVVLKLLCSDLGVSAGELNQEVGHRSSICRVALVKGWNWRAMVAETKY